jgi:hypothetical protein
MFVGSWQLVYYPATITVVHNIQIANHLGMVVEEEWYERCS